MDVQSVTVQLNHVAVCQCRTKAGMIILHMNGIDGGNAHSHDVGACIVRVLFDIVTQQKYNQSAFHYDQKYIGSLSVDCAVHWL